MPWLLAQSRTSEGLGPLDRAVLLARRLPVPLFRAASMNGETAFRNCSACLEFRLGVSLAGLPGSTGSPWGIVRTRHRDHRRHENISCMTWTRSRKDATSLPAGAFALLILED
jgi:hypothetical protein